MSAMNPVMFLCIVPGCSVSLSLVPGCSVSLFLAMTSISSFGRPSVPTATTLTMLVTVYGVPGGSFLLLFGICMQCASEGVGWGAKSGMSDGALLRVRPQWERVAYSQP